MCVGNKLRRTTDSRPVTLHLSRVGHLRLRCETQNQDGKSVAQWREWIRETWNGRSKNFILTVTTTIVFTKGIPRLIPLV